MKFLQGKNIRIPEDIQIIGFDDSMASKESNPSLTTIHQEANLRQYRIILCFFVMVMGFTFPVNALCLKAHSFWPTVLLHASHNVFVRSIFHAAAVNGPYAQYYQLFLLFVLPIKIRMS